MKKLFSILFMTTFLFTACSSDGERGPQGPPGQDGQDGINGGTATIFEINSDFFYDGDANLWTTDFLSFEDFTDVEVLETDIVLIYRLDAVGQLDDGSDVDEWSMLPQNFFTDEGTIQYVFNHTFVDTEIFIDGNYDLSSLSNDFTTDQIFRIAIIPADFHENASFDSSNFGSLMNSLDLKEQDIKKVGKLK
ncbi:collagen-like protein [Salegentibacter sp. JZCK2]|uniref:collagen-like protein n=1 Tax=Salegentibacter tibetensis TaxID=2873600 RepID=UPI001CCE7008|nr:collagen-like protein [Salegentibacter tibetensis]MBZ9731463.1 collagen-like protein [Salegentibacter tibetensis]